MASILPNGKSQFVDANGAPYASGQVFFYTPNTLTFKDTYQDAAQTILNTNPVVLDAAGRAVIYGNGAYRQRLYDALGNLIWDQVTSSVVSQAMEPVVGAATTAAATSALQYIGTEAGAVVRSLTSKMGDFVSPADFGAVGDGIADDTAALQSAFATSNAVNLGSAAYKISNTLVIRDGFCLQSSGATILTTSPALVVLSANGTSDWSILGKLTLQGPGYTNPGVNPNSSGNTGVGLYIMAGRRWKIFGVFAEGFPGYGFKHVPDPVVPTPADYGDSGCFYGCVAKDCYIGFQNDCGTDTSHLSTEYTILVGFQSTGCSYGANVSAGNTQMIGGVIASNTDGLTMYAGINATHGSFAGLQINHNSGFGLNAQSQTAGASFVGCHFYGDSATTNAIRMVNCYGMIFSGGVIETSVYNDNTLGVGYNFIVNNYNNDNFPGQYIKGGENPERVVWLGNINPYGSWYMNDDDFYFVQAYVSTTLNPPSGTDTAIVYGGVTKNARAASYNSATGIYTAPVAGAYQVSITFRVTGATVSSGGYISLKQNGAPIAFASVGLVGSTTGIANLTTTVVAAAADTISASCLVNGSSLAVVAPENNIIVRMS